MQTCLNNGGFKGISTAITNISIRCNSKKRITPAYYEFESPVKYLKIRLAARAVSSKTGGILHLNLSFFI